MAIGAVRRVPGLGLAADRTGPWCRGSRPTAPGVRRSALAARSGRGTWRPSRRADAVLEAELRVQVLAYDHVLQLRGLYKPPQLLLMRHHHPDLRHGPTPGRSRPRPLFG